MMDHRAGRKHYRPANWTEQRFTIETLKTPCKEMMLLQGVYRVEKTGAERSFVPLPDPV